MRAWWQHREDGDSQLLAAGERLLASQELLREGPGGLIVAARATRPVLACHHGRDGGLQAAPSGIEVGIDPTGSKRTL